MYLREAVVEEEAEQAGGEADVLAERGVDVGADEGLQLRARLQVEVGRQAAAGGVATRSLLQVSRQRPRADGGGGEEQAHGGGQWRSHPLLLLLLLLLLAVSSGSSWLAVKKRDEPAGDFYRQGRSEGGIIYH
jgi:hypothetical protein